MHSIDIKKIANQPGVGGIVALSKKLGMSRGAVSQWKRVPAERVLSVEHITGVPRHEIRPDIYPMPIPALLSLADATVSPAPTLEQKEAA